MCHAYSITTNVEALRQFVRDVARLNIAPVVANMEPQWTSVAGWSGSHHDRPVRFLTTEANDVDGRHNPDSMPVILRTADEVQDWLTAPWS